MLGEADLYDQPQKLDCKSRRTSVSYNYNGLKEARSSSRLRIDCRITRINGICTAADLNDRPDHFLLFSLSVYSIDLTDDGKLRYGFTSADELEEVDIGPGDKP
jgi:hypothetical protein